MLASRLVVLRVGSGEFVLAFRFLSVISLTVLSFGTGEFVFPFLDFITLAVLFLGSGNCVGSFLFLESSGAGASGRLGGGTSGGGVSGGGATGSGVSGGGSSGGGKESLESETEALFNMHIIFSLGTRSMPIWRRIFANSFTPLSCVSGLHANATSFPTLEPGTGVPSIIIQPLSSKQFAFASASSMLKIVPSSFPSGIKRLIFYWQLVRPLLLLEVEQ